MKVLNKFLSEVGYLGGGYLVKPRYISLITTFRCNLKCRTCAIWQKKDFEEMDAEEWLEVSREIKKCFPSDTFIEINGGEPLLDKELVFELVKDLKAHFSKIALNSNGILIDRKTIKKLEKIGLDTLKISFYSLNKKVHNSIRGSETAYQAKQAVDLALKSGVNLEAGILLTKENILDIPQLMEYLSQRGAINILQPLDEIIESKESKSRNNYLPWEQWPKKEEIRKFFSWLRPRIGQLRMKTPLFLINQMERYYLEPESVLKFRCFAGQRNLVIYPDGQAGFCFKSGNIGNLKKQNLKDILRGKRAFIKRKEINNCQKYCRIIGCNFSRGIKEYLTQ